MKDLRFQKTEIAIRKSFFKLLKGKKVSEITVTQLCSDAVLGRGTFYLHYKDIYDLLEQIENEYLMQIKQFYIDAFPTTNRENSEELIDKLLDYISDNLEEMSILAENISTQDFLSKLTKTQRDCYINEPVPEMNSPEFDPKYESVEASFVVSGFIGVLMDWIRGTLYLTKEEISNHLKSILSRFYYE